MREGAVRIAVMVAWPALVGPLGPVSSADSESPLRRAEVGHTDGGESAPLACRVRYRSGVNTLDENIYVMYTQTTIYVDPNIPGFRYRLKTDPVWDETVEPGQYSAMGIRRMMATCEERLWKTYVTVRFGSPLPQLMTKEVSIIREVDHEVHLPATEYDPPGIMIHLGDPACWLADEDGVIHSSEPATGCENEEEEEDETPADDRPLRITNLRSGPVCEAGTAEIGRAPSNRICPARDIAIRGEDTCVFDGEEKRCTWWGFEFDYENADPEEPLVCVWTRSLPVNEGNYEEVRSRSIATDTVRYDLEGTSGHYYFPGFDTFPEGFPYPWITVDLEYDCSYRDRPLFELNHRLIFSNAFD